MPKNKLIIWFFGWFAIMLVIGFLTQSGERPSKLDSVSFETTESAELYFKNMRSFYYKVSDEGNGVFEAYRLSAALDQLGDSSLVFVIYNNWRHNMAYVRVDTSYLNSEKINYLVSLSANGSIDTLSLPNQLNESQFAFAKAVYLAAANRKRLAIISQKDTLWITEANAINLRKTLKDYFRLVGKL